METQNYQQFLRKERILKILKMVKDTCKQGKTVDKDKLIAFCFMELGASRRTVLEYLKGLEQNKQILIVENDITLK